MEREEARVLHLLLRPAEFEEVVRCLQPLLHLGIVLDDNAVEDNIYRRSVMSILEYISTHGTPPLEVRCANVSQGVQGSPTAV